MAQTLIHGSEGKLVKYINIDVIASIKENFPNDVEKLIKVEKKNSKTKSLIINNITDDIYEHVKNLKNS
jgi:predicted CopG family antitoxin